MAFLPMALTIASTAISAIGAIKSANAQADAAEYNAQIATQNAQIATQQGRVAAEQQERAARQKIGLAIANYGSSGVDGTSGSPLDVLVSSARDAKMDNLTTQYNYALKANGYMNSATLDEANADNARTSGYLSAAGIALGGASKAYGQRPGSGNALPDSLTA